MMLHLMRKVPSNQIKKNSNYYLWNINVYRKDIAAFDIDSKVKDGRLALMYRGNINKP
jgi:hypothetical protein